MIETFLQPVYLILGIGIFGAVVWSLRGWYDRRQDDAEERLIARMMAEFQELEAFKPDTAALDAATLRRAALADKIKLLKAKAAALP